MTVLPREGPGLGEVLARGLGLDWLLAAAAAAPAADLELPSDGLCDRSPLPWWAAGSYSGALRQRLLRLRDHPDREAMAGLVPGLAAGLATAFGASAGRPLLVPIPSWKRQANPLPGLLSKTLARQLGWRISPLLRRSRPVLGQHHLGRQLRWANQAGAFLSERPDQRRLGPRPPVLLVDDILTTGATAMAAAAALHAAGWRLAGMACLARTPWKGGDLRSIGRSGDGPG